MEGWDDMAISREEVLHVAKLARLELTDAELDRLTGELSAILEAVSKVSELDLADVPPTSHPLALVNAWAEDEPRPALAGRGVRERARPRRRPLQGAPDRMTPRVEEEIRAAERALEAALQALDPTAWVDCYTEDAVFVGPSTWRCTAGRSCSRWPGDDTAVIGVDRGRANGGERRAGVRLRPRASWVNGRPPNEGATTDVRFPSSGAGRPTARRVSLELLNAGSESPS